MGGEYHYCSTQSCNVDVIPRSIQTYGSQHYLVRIAVLADRSAAAKVEVQKYHHYWRSEKCTNYVQRKYHVHNC